MRGGARGVHLALGGVHARGEKGGEERATKETRAQTRAEILPASRGGDVVGARGGFPARVSRVPGPAEKPGEEFEGGAGRDQLDGEEPPETRERRARGGNLLVRDRVGGRRRRHSLANPPREIIDAT